MPHIPASDRGPFRPVEDTILIELATRSMSSMKPIGHELGRTNRDVFREHGVQGACPLCWRPRTVCPKTRHLAQRMHTSIGATGSNDRHGGLTHLQDGTLDRLLNRGLMGLPLPARIAGAVILQRQFEGRHRRGEPDGREDYRTGCFVGLRKAFMPSLS